MYLGFSILSAFFFFFLIGLFIKPLKSQTLSITLVSLYGKSLWLSWFIFLFVFITDYTFLPSVIVSVGCVVLAYQWLTSKEPPLTHVVAPKKRGLMISLSIIILLLLTLIDFKSFTQYDLVFSTWDALVSWNRWASQLADGVYMPLNAAYPIIYPGIWSLIYQAQGDNIIYFVTKGSTIILLLVLAGYSVSRLIEEFSIASLTIFCVAIFVFFDQFSLMTGGYMDVLMSALMFLGLVTFIQALVNFDQSKSITSADTDIFYTSSFLLAAAAITKQPGISASIITISFILILALKKHLPIQTSRNLLLVTLLPGISFTIFFMLSGERLAGNLALLESLVDNAVGKQDKYLFAYNVISNEISSNFLISMGLLSTLNLSFRKKYTAFFGLMCLCIGAAGFMFFADCCSYHYRNGIWLVALLSAAAVAGASQIPGLANEKNYTHLPLSPMFSKAAVLCVILLFSSAVFFLPNKEAIHTIHNEKLKTIGVQQVNNLLYKNLDKLSDNGFIITTYAFAKWLPEIKDRSEFCNTNLDYHSCIKQVVKDRKDILMLKFRNQYRELNEYLHPSAFINNARSWELFYIEDGKQLLEYMETSESPSSDTDDN